MKIAIIGCGMIADTHVKEIRKITGTEIVAVCDQESLMASQLAERYDVPAHFTQFDELLEKCKPDIVHILTPPATHLQLGVEAMQAGCHVLMEKPFAVNLQEARTLIECALALDRKIVVNHFHNFAPPSIQLRKMVLDGSLGQILHLESYYGYRLKSPVAGALLNDRHSWVHRLPGKLLQNNIDHLIGKIVEFIPDKAPAVHAYALQISQETKKISHSFVHDELRVMLTGEVVSAYATFSSNIHPFQHLMTVYGTQGTALIDYESRTLVVVPHSGLPGPFGKLVVPFLFGKKYLKEGFKNLIQFGRSRFHFYAGANFLFHMFYRCVSENSRPPIAYDQMLKASQIMDRIFEQIAQAPTSEPENQEKRQESPLWIEGGLANGVNR